MALAGTAFVNFEGDFSSMNRQAKGAGGKAADAFGGQFKRDVNGKLRDSRGRFVDEGKKAGDGFGRGVNDGTKRGWSLFGRSGKKAGEDAGKGASRGFLGSFKGIATGAAVIGGASLFKGFVDSASNMQETISKSNTVFGNSAKDIENWSKTAASSFGQSQQGALDAAGTFGNLFVQLGIGSAEAAKLSKSQVELASDFASFHNTSPEAAIEAMTAAYRGEYDAVQKYVPTITAAAVEQQGLKMGLAGSTKELTAQDKALATQTLLTKGAGDAMGDFDRTAGGTANTQRRLSAVWADMQARLGQGLLPIVTTVAGFFADNLPAALNFARDAFSTVRGAVGRFMSALSPIISFVKSNPAPVFIGLGAAILTVLVPAFLGWAASAGLAAISTVLLNLPLIALVAAVALVVGALVYAYKNFEGFRRVVDTVFAALKVAAGVAINFVVDLFRNYLIPAAQAVGSFFMGTLLPIIKTVWSGILSAVKTAINFAVDLFRNYLIPAAMAVGTFFTGTLLPIIKTVWAGILSAIKTAWGFIQTIFSALVTAAMAVGTFFTGTLLPLIKTVWSGILSAIKTAWGLIQTIFNAITTVVRTVLIPIFNAYMGVAKFVFSIITAVIRDAWATVSPIFTAIVGFVRGRLMTIFNSFKSTGETVFRAVHGAVTAAWAIISPVFSAIVSFVRDKLTPVWKGISSAVSTAFDAIPKTIGKALSKAGNLIAGFLRGAAGIADKIGIDDVATALRNGATSADKWGEGYARGGSLPPFVTSGPRAIVGEGNPRWPEYVIPTDPQYRGRAQGLWQEAGTQLLAGGGVMGRDQVGTLAKNAGFSSGQLATAAAVAQAESGFNPNAVNRNSNGSIDRGLWQINSIHGALSTFDPQRNANAAHSISSGGSNWRPWVAYKSGAYRKFMTGGDAGPLGFGTGGGGVDLGFSPQDATLGAMRDLAAGSLERIWKKMDVPNSILGLVPGGANYLRQKAVDFIKGESASREKFLAATVAHASNQSGGGFARSGGGGPAGNYTPAMLKARSDVLGKFGQMSVGGYANRNVQGTGKLSDHARYRAWDFMVGSNRGKGNSIASHLLSKSGDYGLKYLIWHDQINSGGGWRPYSHPGNPGGKNPTLAHRDHVHASFMKEGGVMPVSAHARNFDSGGTLNTGWNMVRNDTGGPEQLAPTGGRGPLVGTVVTRSPEDIDMLVRRMAFSLGGVG